MRPQTALLTAAQLNEAIGMWLLYKRGIAHDGPAFTTVTYVTHFESLPTGQLAIITDGCRVVVSEPQDAIIDLDNGRMVQ